ncbi:hypothetical protein ACLEC2_16245 [Lonsdalea quercina]|uniref:hypothetical protein n=1 Tax=Lonsdalea quercina TaxID=71657 RepID=UPI003976483F
MASLLRLNACPHIMADAYVCDERRSLAFLSVWGRDTAIQELLARLTLKNEEALTQLTLTDVALHEHTLFPGNTDNLNKRTSRHGQTRFGTLVHLWLFDKRCQIPDRVNHQAILLTAKDDPLWRQRAWALLRETCSVPLLDHWQTSVLEILRTSQMLAPLPGSYGSLSGWRLSVDVPLLTELMSQAISRGELRTSFDSPLSSVPRLAA